MKSLSVVTAIVLLSAAAYFLYWRGYYSPMPQSNPMATTTESVDFQIEEVARSLRVPWSLVWTSPTRILVTERPGRIRVIENGTLRDTALHTFNEVSTGGEEGLMSLAVHPHYASNKYVYASYAYESERGMWVKVVRFVDNGDSISNVVTIIDAIPAARFHAGCRLAFGPDGKLYITSGDATDREIAQDLKNLGGKILRVNDDGSIPSDNPFPKSPIWSYGHRNPQGLAWDSTGNLYETEHGPSGFDGPGGGDEVNRIIKGGNYGWPLVSHGKTGEGLVDALLVFTPAEAPGSAMIYSGKVFPQFKDNLFFGALIGEGLMRVTLSDDIGDMSHEKLFYTEYGRIRDVAEGPDGYIYFSTSNHDGRGSPVVTDDRVMRLVPKR